MAQKRMFDKNVVSSDKFLDLPNSSKALYFMAGMDADDRGFFQPRKLQRMCGFSDDDFKILIAKGFFITFESGVMVVTDWNKNNWLDSRRVTETEYIDELNLLKLINQKYELNACDNFAKPTLSQNSIEENRIVENSIEENNIGKTPAIYEIIEKNFNRTLAPMEVSKISEWVMVFPEDVIKLAVERAVLQNKKTFNYVIGILNNWKAAGYKTINDIEQNEQKIFYEKEMTFHRSNTFVNKKNEPAPNWMYEEPESNEATPEEIAELERQLENI